jgi:hypothetical protein
MDSILSTGERRVAELLADGKSVEEIAEARAESVEATEKAVERVREKTDRALATLVESPFTAAAAADLDDDERARLGEQLAPD